MIQGVSRALCAVDPARICTIDPNRGGTIQIRRWQLVSRHDSPKVRMVDVSCHTVAPPRVSPILDPNMLHGQGVVGPTSYTNGHNSV